MILNPREGGKGDVLVAGLSSRDKKALIWGDLG